MRKSLVLLVDTLAIHFCSVGRKNLNYLLPALCAQPDQTRRKSYHRGIWKEICYGKLSDWGYGNDRHNSDTRSAYVRKVRKGPVQYFE